MKTNRQSTLAIAFCLALVLGWTGCATQQQQKKPAPAPAPAPAPTPKPAPAPLSACNDTTWGLIRLSEVMPADVTVGAEFTVELKVSAAACAGGVVVTDVLPTGLIYVSSQPAASVNGSTLTWKLGDMDAGAAQTIKITLRVEKEGTYANCATVAADPRTCSTLFVGKPALAIDKTGPQTAMLGSNVTYNIVVKNTGSAVARNVVMTDAVPEGMSGQPATINMGDLAPGQSKNASVTYRADRRGKVVNSATATSSNAGKVSDDAPTVIMQPGLKIEKTTKDKDLLINRAATYDIVVSNTGDTPLTGVVVTDTAASETVIATAEGATVTGSTATWNVGELKAGEKKNLTIKIVSKVPGSFTDTASVTSNQGLRDSARETTLWRGVTGILLEMVDDPDPIQVNEISKFTIRVSNQGTTIPIQGLNIVVTLPAELDVVPGTVSDGGVVNGKKITWPAIAEVGPKASVTRTYTVKGVKAGDARSVVAITTAARRDPIEKFESTTVY
jgi:uncharacterized repeat protein (TIGR01451 family)